MRTLGAIATSVLLLSAVAAMAHGGRFGKQGRVSLVEYLGLTADQESAVAALKEDLAEQQQTVHEAFRAGLEEILTAEQLEAIETMRGEGRHHKISADDLGLSDEQIASLGVLKEEVMGQKRAFHEEFREALEALLTAEQLELLAERPGCNGRVKSGDGEGDAVDSAEDGSPTASELSLETAPTTEAATAVEETSWASVKRSLR